MIVPGLAFVDPPVLPPSWLNHVLSGPITSTQTEMSVVRVEVQIYLKVFLCRNVYT